MSTCALIILDGVGLRDSSEFNALAAAQTPTLDELLAHYPNSQIATSGLAVGLPEGQMGNSEVGHMNLGAGRVVYQSLTRIDKAIADGEFSRNAALLNLVEQARQRGGAVHLMGLLSPGGVHSHIDQIIEACKVLVGLGVNRYYVHAYLDGRDTPPRSAAQSIEALETVLAELGHGRIATVVGRYFALDRDNRWSRIEVAYRAMVEGQANYHAGTASDALAQAYVRGESDEFVASTAIGEPVPLQPEDALVFINFRPDRARQLCQALISPEFTGFERPFVIPATQLLTLTR